MNYRRTRVLALAACMAVAGSPVRAAGVAEIVNYREYTPTFASAGQPTAEQLQLLRDEGYERIIYVAFSDQERSLPHEDRLVKELGMEYVHIPVDWDAPTMNDFELISAALGQAPDKKTLLHCQVNFRASAFSFLYRVLYDDVPIAEAKADMNAVWTPNEVWRDLIFEVLASGGVSPDCDGCDWSIGEN